MAGWARVERGRVPALVPRPKHNQAALQVEARGSPALAEETILTIAIAAVGPSGEDWYHAGRTGDGRDQVEINEKLAQQIRRTSTEAKADELINLLMAVLDEENPAPANKVLTWEEAAQVATQAFAAAAEEFAKGHYNCADFKMHLGALWLSTADLLSTKELQSPNLGLARTEELLREIQARFEVSTPNAMALENVRRLLGSLSRATLDYRTSSGNRAE